MDQMLVPYVRFMAEHRWLLYLTTAAPFVALWLIAGPKVAVVVAVFSLVMSLGSYLVGRSRRRTGSDGRDGHES
jgi:hypothetical protein